MLDHFFFAEENV